RVPAAIGAPVWPLTCGSRRKPGQAAAHQTPVQSAPHTATLSRWRQSTGQRRSVMSEDHYIASHSAEAFERERLGLLERVADPITLRRLHSLGVREGWRCLEIGAGHGSVARWLAKQVGPQGQVVATDLNPRFLRELAAPNITVRHHDILHDELEEAHYDLVHCRFLLMHLSQPQRAVERMAAAGRHGGWRGLE